MALHRKAEALMALKPDIAIVCETAEPSRLVERSSFDWIETEPVWIGDNPSKGIGVFAFNGYRVCLDPAHASRLRYVLPVRISGPARINLLAVWAQNASAGITRKHQPGPLRLALTRYRSFLEEGPAIIAGDWNNNVIWDRPGWRINHRNVLRALEGLDLVSAYHAAMNEDQGQETIPTHYWRDRREDGPTYHIDYIFLPREWLGHMTLFDLGSFADWCGNGLSDHVPLTIDLDLPPGP